MCLYYDARMKVWCPQRPEELAVLELGLYVVVSHLLLVLELNAGPAGKQYTLFSTAETFLQPQDILIFLKYYFVCMSSLPGCMSIHLVDAWCLMG